MNYNELYQKYQPENLAIQQQQSQNQINNGSSEILDSASDVLGVAVDALRDADATGNILSVIIEAIFSAN